MNLAADRGPLVSALKLLSGLARKEFPYSHALLAATEGDLAGELSLSATDEMDILTVELEAEVARSGRLICPLAAFQALAEAEGGPTLALKLDRGRLAVSGASVRGSVPIGDPDAYPTLFPAPEDGWTALPRAVLWEAIERAMGLAGTAKGTGSGLDGVLVRGPEVLSWHGWHASLETVPIEEAQPAAAVITHANWRTLKSFDEPAVKLLSTSTHHIWRQTGTTLFCRRSEKEANWPAADYAGLVLLHEPAPDGLTVAHEQAQRLLAAEKAIANVGGVPMLVWWDGKALGLSRESDTGSARVGVGIEAAAEPFTFSTKDLEGFFGALALVKEASPAVLSPWEHGLRITINRLTVTVAPFGG